jgi:hypothetical protein
VVPDLESRPLLKEEAEAKERNLARIEGRISGVSRSVAPAPPETPPPPKRVVTREGIVRYTLNIQAPAAYVLEALDTGKTINYLLTTSPEVSLKPLKGKRVLVTGEEALDRRWPNTPVLTLETIRESTDVSPR